MNIFEQELRRLAKACGGISSPVFAGRACYGDLGGDNRVKLQFVTLNTADHYEALKVTVLNRSEGEVDRLLVHFKDVWGKKYDHAYMDGAPYLRTYNGKTDWYIYTPIEADMWQLAGEISGYLAVFTVRDSVREQNKSQTGGKESVIKKLREAKQNPAPRKKAPGRDRGPEI